MKSINQSFIVFWSIYILLRLLQRVQGYLASVAGIESTSSPPSHLHSALDAASVVHAAKARSGDGDGSSLTSNLAPQDYHMEAEAEPEPEPEQRMQTDAMAAAMAAAAAAAGKLKRFWT